jgi:hypothetical protein
MWFVQRKEILTKDNLVKRNWKVLVNAAFVIMTSLYNTYSSSAHLQKSSGRLFTWLLILLPRWVLGICLEIGLMVLLNLEKKY